MHAVFHSFLCCVVHCVVLCCALFCVVHCVVLCCVVHCFVLCIVLCCALCCVVLYIVLCCVVLCFALHCVVLCCVVLYLLQVDALQPALAALERDVNDNKAPLPAVRSALQACHVLHNVAFHGVT